LIKLIVLLHTNKFAYPPKEPQKSLRLLRSSSLVVTNHQPLGPRRLAQVVAV